MLASSAITLFYQGRAPLKTFREALQSKELTLTAELTLTPTLNAVDIVNQARSLAAATDAIQVPDQRYALPHVSNIATAAHLIQAGIDPILHINCRDRNRIALQSDLLSAHSFGVSNLLIMRGSKLPADQLPKATGIYDYGAIDLIKTAAAIRDGDIFTGEKLPVVRDFYIGTVGTAFNPGTTWEPEKLITKADAGAQFVQLQICLNTEVLKEYMTRLVAAKLIWRYQVLVSIPVLRSAEDARLLRSNLPQSIIPRETVKRIEQASDPEQEGINICAEQLDSLADVPGVSGATLLTPGDPELITAAVYASRARSEIAQSN